MEFQSHPRYPRHPRFSFRVAAGRARAVHLAPHMTVPWSKDAYENSVSSRCWAFTPYSEGWDRCPDLRNDQVLQRLVEEESALGPVPPSVQEIVERSIELSGRIP